MPAKKKNPGEPIRRPAKVLECTRDQIAERAYYLWLADPPARADPVANWLQAERELAARSGSPRARRAKTAP